MGMYKKWNCCLCKELCDHMECFEKNPSVENLCIIKEITEVITNLQEMEFSGAMRHYAEEKLGYDSETGHFEKDENGEWDEYDLGIYNAMNRRRRDSRGRYMKNRPGEDWRMSRGPYNVYYPSYYNMDDGTDDEWEDKESMMDVQNAGGRMGRNRTPPGSVSRNTYNYGNMPPYYDDGNMYRVRQKNGIPMMERLYAHGEKRDTPKKLTEQMGEEWMKHLENDDGTIGPHFSKEEIRQMAQKHSIKFEDFSEWELYLATNMMYSDYCDSISTYTKNPDAYLKMAVDFLDDEDFNGKPSEKLALYYCDVVKHKE